MAIFLWDTGCERKQKNIYSILHAVVVQVSWKHYLSLIIVGNIIAMKHVLFDYSGGKRV